MKITSLTESNTPSSSTSNTTNSAPKFGRSDEFLEETEETVEESTTAGAVASVPAPIGKVQSRGSMLKGIKTSDKYPNSKAVKEGKNSELDSLYDQYDELDYDGNSESDKEKMRHIQQKIKDLKAKEKKVNESQINEVDPRNFDSDVDYYAARNAPAKARSHSRPSPGVNQDDEAYFREIFRKKRLAAQQAERNADHDRLATGTNEAVDEGEEFGSFAELKDWREWNVTILNNFYAGKYADYSARYYSVVASSPEEARQVVLDNPDYVLKDLLARKLQNGKKVLPRSSALPIEDKRVRDAKPGSITTVGFKQMLTPQGPMLLKFASGKIIAREEPLDVEEGMFGFGSASKPTQQQKPLDYNAVRQMSQQSGPQRKVYAHPEEYRKVHGEFDESSFDYTMKDLGNDYAGFPSNHSMKHKFLAKIKPEKQQLYKDKMNNTRDWDSLFALFKVAKARGDIIEQGVAEADASTASFRQGNIRRAATNAMSPEERKAHEDKRAEQQRKRDDARMERERQRNAAKKGVAEGVAETMSMDEAKKVLRHYGADNFKTTSNELYFYKNGQQFSVDLTLGADSVRTVSVNQLNQAARQLKGQGVTEMDGDGAGRSGGEHGKEHTGKVMKAKDARSMAKKAWDWATEPIHQAHDIIAKDRAKNIANIRKNKESKSMGLNASLEQHADDKMKELGHKFKPVDEGLPKAQDGRYNPDGSKKKQWHQDPHWQQHAKDHENDPKNIYGNLPKKVKEQGVAEGSRTPQDWEVKSAVWGLDKRGVYQEPQNIKSHFVRADRSSRAEEKAKREYEPGRQTWTSHPRGNKEQGVAEGYGEDDGIYIGAKVYHKEHQSGEPFEVVKILDDQRVGVVDEYGNKKAMFIDKLVPAQQGVAEEQSQPVKYRATVEYGPTAADAHFVTVTANSTEEAEAKVAAWCKKKGVRNPMITINGADKPVAEEKQRLDPKCWSGYKKQGTKMKGDTRVNNCVPVSEAEFNEDKLAQDLYKDLQIFKKGADKDIGGKAKDKEISSKAKDKEIQKKK